MVGITGASGAVYGVRLLERARALGLETHLVVTPPACSTPTMNWAWTVPHWTRWPTGPTRQATWAPAWPAGSFDTAAMVVAPCSMKTLAAVAHGFGDNLLTRAADVTLKERRRWC